MEKNFKHIKKFLSLITLFLVAICFVGCSPKKDNYSDVGVETMYLEIGTYTFEIDLQQNKTVAALVEILPLDVNMSELNGNEKYFYLNVTLPTNTQKVGQIKAGDIMFWQDNCLVIFYKSFSTPLFLYQNWAH